MTAASNEACKIQYMTANPGAVPSRTTPTINATSGRGELLADDFFIIRELIIYRHSITITRFDGFIPSRKPANKRNKFRTKPSPNFNSTFSNPLYRFVSQLGSCRHQYSVSIHILRRQTLGRNS